MYEDIPIDRRQRLLSVLSIEGQVASLFAGLSPDDSLVLPKGWEEDDD